MNQANPTLAEVFRLALARGSAELRVSCPGRIERFDPDLQVADVKPLLMDSDQGDEGQEIVSSVAVVPSVPVQFAGGGGFAETWPVAVGDLCELIFTDRSIDRWFSQGGEVDPVDLARHVLTGAVCVLGIRDSKHVLTEFDHTRAVWGNKGPRVAADGNAVHLGVAHNESGTQEAIRGSEFLTQLDTLLTALDTDTTTAGTSITTAATSLESAAPLNAVPFYGGSMAASFFVAAGVALNAAGVALEAIKGSIASFKATRATLSTPKVKTP